MYTLEYIDDKFGFMFHRWDEDEYERALLVAQWVDRSSDATGVIFKHNGEYAEIWPTYIIREGKQIPYNRLDSPNVPF